MYKAIYNFTRRFIILQVDLYLYKTSYKFTGQGVTLKNML